MKTLPARLHSSVLRCKPHSAISRVTVLLCAQAPETGIVHISIGHRVVNLCQFRAPNPRVHWIDPMPNIPDPSQLSLLVRSTSLCFGE